MLKELFTSNTRIKLLTVFLMNPGEEYFIRELTRLLDEQINSVRRELNNLHKMGLLKAREKNRKKYYHANEGFVIYEELKSIISKAQASSETLVKDLKKMGDIKLLLLSGQFIGKPESDIDLLIVGDIDRTKFMDYIKEEVATAKPVRFTIMPISDYQYRLSIHDKFLIDLINSPESQVPIKTI
ncbi:hypothetical protein CVV38_02735 [Candidatus Peregrinibacteria bacterium HGW-Peregrinibacteria-1]|jgi:predicted transcriptional regulator|nr:MAG: hypothetical protein CVV38_02735 [Candidatus Peregrinibacteria bacterium HGW-Peregrinibacteria-1]